MISFFSTKYAPYQRLQAVSASGLVAGKCGDTSQVKLFCVKTKLDAFTTFSYGTTAQICYPYLASRGNSIVT